MSKNWGSEGASRFISKNHHEPYPSLDSTKVQLPNPYVVCIVGASRGIGAGIAFEYAKAGASGLVLASRRTSGLGETAAQCKKLNPNVQVEIVECDIISSQSVSALAEKTRRRFGRLDVVAVNSGFSGPVELKLTTTDPETFKTCSDVNYVGTFLCAKHLIPSLLNTTDGGKTFIAVSSTASFIMRGPIANAQYCSSKLAQLRLMEYIHEQFHDQGILSFAIQPGAVETEMARESAPDVFKPFLIDSPELCGAFCVWLTKDKTKYSWLSGRFVAATWDVEELEGRKEEIIEKDLLKLRLAV